MSVQIQPHNMDFMQQHTQTNVYQELQAPIVDKMVEDDEFDEERGVVVEKTGVIGSVFSYVCTCVGAGVISLPYALQNVGWVGLLVMVIVAFGCNHTAKYLVACMFSKPGKILKTYEDIGEQALGQNGRKLVAFFQCITLFGVCAIFLIIIGGNMATLMSIYSSAAKITYHDYALMAAVVLIPIAWVKTMNEIAYLAIFGVLASLWVAGVVIIKGFICAASPDDAGCLASRSGANLTYQAFDIGGLSNAINIIVFAFGGHSVIPNIVSHMKRPQTNYAKFTGWSYFLIAIIYMTTAAGGYAGYGLKVEDKILKNFDITEPIVKSAYVLITIHVLMAYPIPLNPVSLQLEKMFGIDKKTGYSELISRIILRTLLVLLSAFVACAIPYFGDVLSLVSSLSIVVVAFIFPPLFYYLIFRHTRGFSLIEICILIGIGVGGIAACVIGSYYAIKALVADSSQNPFANFFTN